MKKTVIALAIVASFTAVGNISAGPVEDRLMAMEKRLKYLEQRVASQDQVIAQKDKQISELTNGGEGGWFQNVEIGGVVEIEASRTDEEGGDSNDIITPTVELGIAAQINDWVSGEIVLLYEEETDNDGDLNVDTAMVSIANPDSNWFINAGQYVVPFGTYGTNMVSDPITLDLGETGDSAIEAGISSGGITASVYAFQGDTEETTGSWGAALNYETETEDFAFAGHLGYISNLTESDFEDHRALTNDEILAWVASAELSTGPFTIIGEYLAATDGFEMTANNEEPAVYNIEVGYGFDAGTLPATIAVGFQGSDEAEEIGLPEEKTLAALSFDVMDGTSIAFEYAQEKAYDGADTDTVTGLLSVEF